MNEIDVRTLRSALATDSPASLLDVREAHEFATGHVPGAVSVPMSTLPATVHDLDRSTEYLIICQSGNRSLTVATWLAQQGFRVTNVRGGTFAWQLAGLPLTV
jgi:rhodanese-related sulfurtransferase